MNTALKMSKDEKASLLATLAKQGLMKQKLLGVDGGSIYAVTEDWQISYLKDAKQIAEVQDSDSFKDAAQNPDISAIFVPKTAAMTQEIAARILESSGQLKTVFWEA